MVSGMADLLHNIRCLVNHVPPVHHTSKPKPYRDRALYKCLNCGLNVKGTVTFYPLDGTYCPARCTMEHLTPAEREALDDD